MSGKCARTARRLNPLCSADSRLRGADLVPPPVACNRQGNRKDRMTMTKRYDVYQGVLVSHHAVYETIGHHDDREDACAQAYAHAHDADCCAVVIDTRAPEGEAVIIVFGAPAVTPDADGLGAVQAFRQDRAREDLEKARREMDRIEERLNGLATALAQFDEFTVQILSPFREARARVEEARASIGRLAEGEPATNDEAHWMNYEARARNA